MSDAPATPKQKSLFTQIAHLPGNFWTANVMEMFERLAFFSVVAIRGLFLVAAVGENGLGISHAGRGVILGMWALIQCLVPMVSGGYTERYGYRRSLLFAFSINILGYLLMAWSFDVSLWLTDQGMQAPGFWVYLVAACLVATGTGIFKPPVQGTIARSTNEETSSIAWGLFYWIVNIGGTIAPFAAASLRGKTDWDLVFYSSALWTALNFLPALFIYREPKRAVQDPAAQPKGPVGVFISSIVTMIKDARLVAFMLIFAMFYLMFMQLWDLLPIFISEWVDTSDVFPAFHAIGQFLGTEVVFEDSRQVKPEMIINIDSASIILLVIPISFLIARMNKVAAMILGMIIALVGFVGSGLTSIGAWVCLMILVFAVGEMLCSPTFSAYIGLIAPRDKKALYMGYSNMPFAIGWSLGNVIGSSLYGQLSDKFKFARQYMIEKLNVSSEFATDEKLLPTDQVMETMVRIMDGVDPADLHARMVAMRAGVEAQQLSAADALARVREGYAEILGHVPFDRIQEATNMLWDLHHPYMVWVYLGAIGLAGTLGMIIFYFVAGHRRPATDTPTQP